SAGSCARRTASEGSAHSGRPPGPQRNSSLRTSLRRVDRHRLQSTAQGLDVAVGLLLPVVIRTRGRVNGLPGLVELLTHAVEHPDLGSRRRVVALAEAL